MIGDSPFQKHAFVRVLLRKALRPPSRQWPSRWPRRSFGLILKWQTGFLSYGREPIRYD
jgi:hypothetical protein